MAQVLIVDDHPDVAEVIAQLLSVRGHSVECCASAEAALERVAILRPHVVIADQRLPGMTGLELLGAFQERYPDMSVILCSADDSLAGRATQAGASAFWLKGSEQLFDHVDRLAQSLERESPIAQ